LLPIFLLRTEYWTWKTIIWPISTEKHKKKVKFWSKIQKFDIKKPNFDRKKQNNSNFDHKTKKNQKFDLKKPKILTKQKTKSQNVDQKTKKKNQNFHLKKNPEKTPKTLPKTQRSKLNQQPNYPNNE